MGLAPPRAGWRPEPLGQCYHTPAALSLAPHGNAMGKAARESHVVVEEVIPEPVVEEIIPEPVVEEIIPEPVVEEVIPEPVAEEKAAPAGNVCPQCGFENADGDMFCMECGCNMAAPVELKLYCPACGQENSEGDAFCMKCGQSLAGVAMSAKPPVVASEFEMKAKEAAEKAGKMAKKGAKEAVKLAKKAADSAKKAADKAGKEAKKAAGKAKGLKLPKGALIGAGVAVAIGLVLVILAVCGVFSGGSGSGAEYALYIKDSEIFYLVKGKVLYNDNGTECTLEAGDVMICPAGTGHSISNIGEEDAEVIAVIVYA